LNSIRGIAYPRAALVGNPSDGYFGRTISFAFTDFRAEVDLVEADAIEIVPNERDHSRFGGIAELARDVARYGYYGGLRLLKATVKRFHDHCVASGIALHDRNFTLRYQSDIPGQVGLAGSSAIITACLRALMEFYGVGIPRPVQAGIVLAVENDELGIPAGLQDRVAQVYQGAVFMDFSRDLMERHGHGHYEPLDPALLPPLYIAYRETLAEGTEVFHNDIRARWNRGEPAVVDAMRFWADLTLAFRDALVRGDHAALGPLIDANFDRRRSIYQISRGNIEMIETARAHGASAHFCGSGGAIAGILPDPAAFDRLAAALAPRGVRVLRPTIAPALP
jgi:glucuronokinase